MRDNLVLMVSLFTYETTMEQRVDTVSTLVLVATTWAPMTMGGEMVSHYCQWSEITSYCSKEKQKPVFHSL